MSLLYCMSHVGPSQINDSAGVGGGSQSEYILTMSREWLGYSLNAVDSSLQFYWNVR